MGRSKRTYQAVTIRDVAKLAGVSISTVSRVLNDLDRVSDDSRARVRDAVQKLGYVQNTFATSMVTGQTKIVMIVVPDFIQDYFGWVIQAAEKVFRTNGYLPILISTGEDPEADALSHLNRFTHIIEGALVVATQKTIHDLRGFPKPIVLVDRDIETSGLNSVTLDNYNDCYRLTNYLLEHNHRKIAVLTGNTDLNIDKNRFEGCCQAFFDARLLPDVRYLCKDEVSRESGYNNTRSLLSQADPPTAIVACGEDFIVGALCACVDMGIQPGKDISLVSFDDPAPFAYPPVTSIYTPRRQMGRVAAERLLQMIAHPEDREVVRTVLSGNLYQRNSVVTLP